MPTNLSLSFILSGASIWNMGNKPYIVLVGDVGSGKSTVVEKLTGETGLSSGGSGSKTQTTDYFWTEDGSLMISDTPGKFLQTWP